MSDSINEQRCGRENCTGPHDVIHCLECCSIAFRCPGPSVVTSPAQDEQREERAQVEAWFARYPQDEMQTSRGRVRSLDEYDGWLPTDPDEARAVLARPFPAAPSVSTDHTDEKLSLIGRERVMIEKLAKSLHNEARRLGEYTPIRESRRGNWFEVRLADGRVARVTVELDRIEEASRG